MSSIPLTQCSSSNIKAHGYDAATSTIAVQFSNGSEFRYQGVPASLYQQLASAPSVGSFFAKHIRTAFRGVPA